MSSIQSFARDNIAQLRAEVLDAPTRERRAQVLNVLIREVRQGYAAELLRADGWQEDAIAELRQAPKMSVPAAARIVAASSVALWAVIIGAGWALFA